MAMALNMLRCRYHRDRKKLMRSMSAFTREIGSNTKGIIQEISEKEQGKYILRTVAGKEISKMGNLTAMDSINAIKPTK